MAFATKYRLQFDEQNGPPSGQTYTPIQWKCEILVDGYGGSVIDLQGTENPLSIIYDDIELYKDYIMPSSAILNIISSSRFTEFITAEENDYRMDIYKDGSLFWQGFVVPGEYEEDYTQSDNYDVQIRAIDGLGKADGVNSSGTISTVAVALANALTTLTYTSLEIVENCNLYPDGVTPAAATSPLVNTTVNRDWLKETSSDKWTYYEMLTEICKAYGCILYQQGGKWQFRRIVLNNGGTYTERTLTSAGAYSSNTTGVNPILELKSIGSNQVRLQSKLMFNAPIKEAELTGDTGPTYNYIQDGYFNFWESSTLLSRWTANSGATYQKKTEYLGYGLDFTNSTGNITSNPQYIEKDTPLRLQFKYYQDAASTVSYQLILEGEEGGTYYWNGSTWTTTSTSITYTSGTNYLTYKHYTSGPSATPLSGYIYIKFNANTNIKLMHVCLQRNDQGNLYNEVFRYDSSRSSSSRGIFEDTYKLTDRGGMAFADYGSSAGAYSSIQVRINFATLVNGDRFNLIINGTSRAFTYLNPVVGNTFSNITELLALVKSYYTNDEYGSYTSLVSGSTYDLFVYSNYRDNETGISYNFSYSETTDTNNSFSVIANTNNTNGGGLGNFRREILVGDYPAKSWTDGTLTGGLMDIIQKSIHNQYSTVYQRHRGKLIDYSKSISPTKVLHDATNNNGKYFMFIGGTHELITNEMDGEWIEINTTTSSFTKTLTRTK